MAAKNLSSVPRRGKKVASVQPISTPVGQAQANNGNMEEEIRRRAYEIYLERGGTPGNENEDWLLAEREVRARATAVGRSA